MKSKILQLIILIFLIFNISDSIIANPIIRNITSVTNLGQKTYINGCPYYKIRISWYESPTAPEGLSEELYHSTQPNAVQTGQVIASQVPADNLACGWDHLYNSYICSGWYHYDHWAIVGQTHYYQLFWGNEVNITIPAENCVAD